MATIEEKRQSMYPTFRFIEYRNYAFIVSGLILLAGIISFTLRDVEMGIDFVGGISAKIEINGNADSEIDVDAVRAAFTQFDEIIIEQEIPVEEVEPGTQFFNYRIKQEQLGENGVLLPSDLELLEQVTNAPQDEFSESEQALLQRAIDAGTESALSEEDLAGLQTVILKYVVRHTLIDTMVADFAGGDASRVHLLSQEYYSPTIGEEMQQTALVVAAVVSIIILIYISLRFQFRFGVAAVIALVHDTALTIGLVSVLGREINVPLVIAILTLLGYSINDTIVVFDRIRENAGNIRDRDYIDIINLSINQCLSRTIVTSATVLMVTIPMFVAALVLNVDAFFDLSLFLGVGVILGTYSSIFIASPLLYIYETFARKARARRKNTSGMRTQRA